jgi:hypothetical protein
VLGALRDRGFRQPFDLVDVAMELAQHGGVRQCDREREGVGELAGEAQRVLSPRPGPIR